MKIVHELNVWSSSLIKIQPSFECKFYLYKGFLLGTLVCLQTHLVRLSFPRQGEFAEISPNLHQQKPYYVKGISKKFEINVYVITNSKLIISTQK